MTHSGNERYKVLVVDDEPANLDLLRQILKDDYDLAFAKTGFDAIRNVSKRRPDIILLDVMMPGMDGFEVCAHLKKDAKTSDIPVIFCTALNDGQDESRAFAAGAADYITKPIRPPVVLARLAVHLALSDQRRVISREISRVTKELAASRTLVTRMLGGARCIRDNLNKSDVFLISEYSYLLAKKLGWSEAQGALLKDAACVHDIGMIGIPSEIVSRPGNLDPNQWELIKNHPKIGAKFIADFCDQSELFVLAKDIAEYHHEKWDGSGYPYGLIGCNIPVSARIVAVIDVFRALTSDRPYAKAWSVDDAIAFIQAQKSIHFDPDIADAFIEVLPELPSVKDLCLT